MTDQRNLILAIVISIAIVLGFEFLYSVPKMQREKALQAERAQQQTEQVVPPALPGAPGQPAAPATGAPVPPGTLQPPGVAPPPAATRAAALARSPRVTIETAELSGSIALAGGRLDDLALNRFRETVNPGSPPIVLLSPAGAPAPYFTEFGWVSDKPGVALPGPDTVWSADRAVLKPDQPVTLSWDNGQGLTFRRQIAVDQRFMFTVTDTVTNAGGEPLTLYPYSLGARTDKPTTWGFYILHEGPIGVFNETLKELSYDNVKDDRKVEFDTRGGWIGITDKYWLVALIPDQNAQVKARFNFAPVQGHDRYQFDVFGAGQILGAGQTATTTHRVFAGAKEVRVVDGYAEALGISRFDLAIDWGWFFFLTKPIFLALDWIYHQVGNFGLAILILTVIIKLLFFPLANKSYKAMSKMKLLQPEMEKLKQKYGNDRQRMSQELMALYRKEGANPMSGCLPIIIQIPVFFALYKVLFVTIEMRHAPFYGWIRDLSAPDPTSLFNLFGLIPWTPPELLHIGAWPLIMGATMFLQMKLNPQPPDPIQARIFMLMPVIFTVMLASFPAGLVIYWAWNNILSVTQQWVIMKRMGAKPGK